jgi:hypothetical protein
MRGKVIAAIIALWATAANAEPTGPHWIIKGYVCGYAHSRDELAHHNLCHGGQWDPLLGPFTTEKECLKFLKQNKKTIYHKEYSIGDMECVKI